MLTNFQMLNSIPPLTVSIGNKHDETIILSVPPSLDQQIRCGAHLRGQILDHNWTLHTTVVLVIWHPRQTNEFFLILKLVAVGESLKKVLLGHYSNSRYLLKFIQLQGTHECTCAFLGERIVSDRLKTTIYVQTFET